LCFFFAAAALSVAVVLADFVMLVMVSRPADLGDIRPDDPRGRRGGRGDVGLDAAGLGVDRADERVDAADRASAQQLASTASELQQLVASLTLA
jgi:hypothetical protein